jgi:protein-disulfide isomerase
VKKIVFVLALVAVVVGFVFFARQARERRAEEVEALAQEQTAVFVRPHSLVRGEESAKVTLVEFSDPACETCAAFAPVLETYLAAYPGKVKLVLRYAPFHTGADQAVLVLEAARRQGKLWETLHLLYETQAQWTEHHQAVPERIWEVVAQSSLGLDMERLRADAKDPQIASLLQQDLADAQALGVQRTPGIFVNGKPLQPFGLEPLAALVNAEVRAAYSTP